MNEWTNSGSLVTRSYSISSGIKDFPLFFGSISWKLPAPFSSPPFSLTPPPPPPLCRLWAGCVAELLEQLSRSTKHTHRHRHTGCQRWTWNNLFFKDSLKCPNWKKDFIVVVQRRENRLTNTQQHRLGKWIGQCVRMLNVSSLSAVATGGKLSSKLA